MNIADSEGDGVGSCWPETSSSSHEVLGESHLGVEAEMEAPALGSAAVDMASLSASVSSGVAIGGAVVGVGHFVGSRTSMYMQFELVYCWVRRGICVMTTFGVRSVYIALGVMCGAIVALYGSWVACQRVVDGVREGIFNAFYRCVGWSRCGFR